MKKLLVCFIALAMSIGFALAPAMAQNNEDPHYPNMYVDPGGIGDLLLFSLYDVRPVDGRGPLWENYIAIENTSGKWTAFHLRFRAWKKSIEVFDHVILLSPYDVFWMTLSAAPEPGPDAPNGGLTTYPCSSCASGYEPYELGDVLMYSGDTHTLYNSGLIYEGLGQTFWLDKFQDSLLVFNGFVEEGFSDRAPKEEMWAGYIEAIGLWQLSIPGDKVEDTHDLSDVVSDVHPDPVAPGTINVDDALDALFYRFFTADGIVEAGRTEDVEEQEGSPPRFRCDGEKSYTGCWTQYPVDKVKGVDSAWPDFIPGDYDTNNPRFEDWMRPVKIERTTQPFYTSSLVYVDESPTATRFGEDCGNVLTGNVAFGDPQDGKYQMENFIAVRHFRTDPDCELLGAGADCHHWTHTYYTYDDGGLAGCDFDVNWWQHRDGYYGGGIFFPASITDWYYEVLGNYTGGAAHLYYWYYVNSDWATAAGPTLRDGNDFKGLNFNDVNSENPEGIPHGLAPEFNPMVPRYGLTRPFPLNNQAITNPAYAFVHYINDIWSLDDLEEALAKFEIWYTHLRTRVATDPEPKPKGDIDTDVVLTYPTKHDHFFFTDWPFMYYKWDGDCPVDISPDLYDNVVDSAGIRKFWANLLVYRGEGKALFPELLTTSGTKSVEQLVIFASEDNEIEEEKFIEPEYNINQLTLAQWFQQKYLNGRIFVKATLYDNEQNSPKPPPDDEPPGSPWFPDPPPDRWAPHEVNIVRVGELTPEWQGAVAPNTINDLNWLLAGGRYPFHKGHFVIGWSYLEGQRMLWDYGTELHFAFEEVDQHSIYYGSSYLIPPIGLVIVKQNLPQQVGVTRSAMAEWHYLVDWDLLDYECKRSSCF